MSIADMDVRIAKMRDTRAEEENVIVKVICGELGIDPMKLEALKSKRDDDPEKITDEVDLTDSDRGGGCWQDHESGVYEIDEDGDDKAKTRIDISR